MWSPVLFAPSGEGDVEILLGEKSLVVRRCAGLRNERDVADFDAHIAGSATAEFAALTLAALSAEVSAAL